MGLDVYVCSDTLLLSDGWRSSGTGEEDLDLNRFLIKSRFRDLGLSLSLSILVDMLVMLIILWI